MDGVEAVLSSIFNYQSATVQKDMSLLKKAQEIPAQQVMSLINAMPPSPAGVGGQIDMVASIIAGETGGNE